MVNCGITASMEPRHPTVFSSILYTYIIKAVHIHIILGKKFLNHQHITCIEKSCKFVELWNANTELHMNFIQQTVLDLNFLTIDKL